MIRVQGGSIASEANSTGAQVGFPISFSATPNFQTSLANINTSPNAFGVQVRSLNTSGCYVCVGNGSNWISTTVRWLALGT